MQNKQEWNAIVPFNVQTAASWITSLGIVADSTKLYFTNEFDSTGANRVRFNTPNGLVAPTAEGHVESRIRPSKNKWRLGGQPADTTSSAPSTSPITTRREPKD